MTMKNMFPGIMITKAEKLIGKETRKEKDTLAPTNLWNEDAFS
jgi:hypothetical protein